MTWEPTDEVPPTGMAAYAEPDPSLTPLTSLSAGLRLHRIEDRGAWAKVAADNGWSAWVDGRLLVPLANAASPAPPAAAQPAPAPAPFQAPAPAAPIPTPTPAPAPTPTPPADQTVYQPIGAPDAAEQPAVGQPLGAPAGPIGGGVPSAFAPPSGATSASTTRGGIDPLSIAAAIMGLLLVVTYLLPWATFDGFSDHAFELAGDGRGAFGGRGEAGDLGTRTDIGIILLQALYGAIVLGPVAAVLFVARQPAARVVGILAGVAGLLVVAGRLLLDVPTDPGLGLGLWLSLLAAIALVVLSLAAGSRSGTGSSAPGSSPSW
ncbi:MAG: hypothetical protein ACE367_14915 [Acidimicrobiales bacterium]